MRANRLSLAKYLLSDACNASVDAAGFGGMTPLMHAVNGSLEDVMDALLSSGASLSAADASGNTALHWASRKGFAEHTSVRLRERPDWRWLRAQTGRRRSP